MEDIRMKIVITGIGGNWFKSSVEGFDKKSLDNYLQKSYVILKNKIVETIFIKKRGW